MLEYIVNTTTHSATGYAPCTLIFGTESVEDLQMMSKQGLEMATSTGRQLPKANRSIYPIPG